ncbi:YtxH domain-containing protein [Candidatus Nitronereus thalassa]|uniref:YtxH domain-containing protein n=1 Tax=Candidatus Nitronereus thalassa TaxID=3020898 RepID=A0ABU3KCT1_9BACT|nr:YtxH domain-containing protein [Candidatus Nitronereus thalassa]MDT7044269.1 YtxH domain-containing protein [Candidatus Nitronereus thalassa]
MSMLRQVLIRTGMVAGGMAVGAGLGMLFAPHSGRVTRGQIRVQLNKAQDEMTHMGGQVMQHVDSVLEKGKQVLTNTHAY